MVTRNEASNRPMEVNRSMPGVSPQLLKRVDVNGGGTVDEADLKALQEMTTPWFRSGNTKMCFGETVGYAHKD